MKVAFVHYHLKTGGVTTVLKQQVEAIKDACEVLVLTGVPSESLFPVDTIHIPGIGYDGTFPKAIRPKIAAEAVARAICSKWKDGCDVLHVHNPTLAKNKNFLKILKILQRSGIRLFLQIHDFAEDGRPLSYFSDEYVPDCHYGVINSRDYDILLKAGLKKDGLHQIFNTIRRLNFNRKESLPKGYVLYPIRAIRRKNIGEAILLSLFLKNRRSLAVTLPPSSPTDIKSYTGWKAFVKENNIEVAFEVGLENDFEPLVQCAEFLITTSITEGFGFSFLEPWMAGKILWGRKLPDICQDFEKKGVRLDHLYDRLQVPLEWVGKQKLFEKFKSCAAKSRVLFHNLVDEENILNNFEKTVENNIDFGLLDEAFQKQVMRRILSDKKDAQKLIDLNLFLAHPGEVADPVNLIQSNKRAVQCNYNDTLYKKTLLRIYTQVLNTPVRHHIDKKVLLSEFFNFENFNLLKWSDDVEE